MHDDHIYRLPADMPPWGAATTALLFEKAFPEEGYTLGIRPFHLERDAPTVHRWVNMPYARRFWGMQGPLEALRAHYAAFLGSGNGFSLMFFLGSRPVAQIDVYAAVTDEIRDHYDARIDDYGIHVLMGPHRRPIPRLSQHVLLTCLSFLFTLPVGRVMGEPDARNVKANALVRKLGFRFIKQISMSYKTANLYALDRDVFRRRQPV